jgi:hypothetical protein
MLTMERKQITTGSKVLCYIDDYGFTEGNEYIISLINSNGYHITDNDGIGVIFETIEDIKQTFMIEGE